LGERAFSLYDVEQFIREAGAERVTEDAVLDLERELEKLAEDLAARAKRYAEHAGRSRLIRKSDVSLAKPRTIYRIPYSFNESARRTKRASTSER
jgi:histone H3/H4